MIVAEKGLELHERGCILALITALAIPLVFGSSLADLSTSRHCLQ